MAKASLGWFRFLAVATVLGLPLRADAGPLASASLLIDIHSFLQSFPFLFSGSGATGVATSPLGAHVAAGSAFRGTEYMYLPGPSLTYVRVKLKSNGAGSFAGATPSQVGGPLQITGTASFSDFVRLVLPLQIGAPGARLLTNYTKHGGVGLGITAEGASWTAGTAKVTSGGTTVSTVSGANLLTPGGGGTLTLVSPNKVYTSLACCGVISVPAFLTLTFAPVPEPGTLPLLASGVVALAALGRRRGRSEHAGLDTIAKKKRRGVIGGFGLLLLLGNSGAQAGPLVSANLQVEIGWYTSDYRFEFEGLGATGRANGPLSATVGSGSAFRGARYTYLSGPEITYLSLQVGSNASGVFEGATPGQVAGAMLITGALYLFSPPILLPVQIGAPGTGFATAHTRRGGVGVGLTARGASWTAGTAKLTDSGVTVSTITGANLLTPSGGGTLVLVSPNRIFTTLSGSPFVAFPAFLTLTFASVPEPGTLVLLGSGVLALAALGRRRGRSEGPRASSHPSE